MRQGFDIGATMSDSQQILDAIKASEDRLTVSMLDTVTNKVGAAVTCGVAKASARVGPPLARVWRFLVNWKGLIFWRPGN